MLDIAEKLEKAKRAIRGLREKKLTTGNVFMINSNELSSTQCYLEFPDGTIKLVSLNSSSSQEFDIIRVLSDLEAMEIRNRYKVAL